MNDCLIPGISDDLSLLCLARIPFVLRPALRAVSSLWQKALASEDFTFTCKLLNCNREVLCLQFQEKSDNNDISLKLSFELWDSLLGRGAAIPPLSYERLYKGLCKSLNGGETNGSPSAFTDYQVVALGSRLIVLGGTFIWKNTNDNYRLDSDQVWMFDTEKYIWHQLPSMSRPRKRFAAVAIGEQAFIVTGGFLDARAEIFNLKTLKWRAVAKMPTRSFYPPAAIVKDGLVFVVPQMPSIGGPREALLYSVKQNKWRCVPKFWPAEGSLNTCHAMAILNNYFYGICARLDDGSPVSRAAVFRRNMETKEWEYFSPLLAAGEINVADSCNHFLAALHGKIHVVENATSGSVLATRSTFAYVQVLNDTFDDAVSGVQFSSKGPIAPMNIQKWKVSNKLVCGVTVLKV